MKFSNTLIVSALFAAGLSGCGGSSNDTPETNSTPPPPPQTATNTPPASAADTATTTNSASISIDVLANDSDSDGDTLSISAITSEPENGNAVIEGDAITYTPTAMFAGTDSFSYEVSDGELTAEGSVSITNNQTLTIAGLVTDGPISNARVSLTLGDETFSATADEDGNYSLDLQLSNMTDVVLLNALGSEENAQENVELVSFVGNAAELLTTMGDDRLIDASIKPEANITHVSTASFLLVQEANQGNTPDSFAAFSSLMETLNSQNLVELAAFINILVDNPDFTVAEGETTLSVLLNEQAQNAQDAINLYLASIDAIDENGEPNDVFETAQTEAIASTLSNTAVLPRFTPEIVNDANLVVVSGNVFPGFIPNSGETYQLSANGSGAFYSEVDVQLTNYSSDISWQLNEGIIDFSFSHDITDLPETFLFFTEEELRQEFGDEIADTALEIIAELPFESNLILVEKVTSPVSAQLTPINIGNRVVQAQLILNTEEFVRFETNQEFFAIESESDVTIENVNLLINSFSVLENASQEEIAGRWVFPLDYEYIAGFDGISFSDILDEPGVINELPTSDGIQADLLTLQSNGTASGRESDLAFNWQLSAEGEIVLTNETSQYVIQPIIDNGVEMLAQISVFSDGELQNVIVQNILRADPEVDVVEDDFVSSLPVVSLKFGNDGFDADNWTDGQWNANNFFLEPVFNAGGALDLIGFDRTNSALFFTGPEDRTGFWDFSLEDGLNYRTSFVSLNIPELTFTEAVQWIPMGVNENGTMYVFQLRAFFGEDISLANGRLDDVETDRGLTSIPPQIEIIIPTDLSGYEEYDRSIELGIFPPLP